ncbi:MAG TPA: TlpA disulfide reductase family protein [Pyrinomonadaceae bacterium]|nr:TlpA disulfide reductase family protein [Pyrinomonadaceae bacterium]
MPFLEFNESPRPRRAQATTAALAVALVCLLVCSACGGGPKYAVAREHGWTTLDGRRAKLADYRGQVVVLDLYATYCPPCLEEIPHLIAIQRRFGSQGLHVIGLNAGGEEDQKKVPEYIQRLGIQYQLGNPDDGLVETLSGQDTAIPKTFVYDRQGRLVKRFTGYDEEVKAGLEAAVQKALESRAD